MGLADEARAQQGTVSKGPVCGIRRLLSALPDEDRDDLITLLDDPMVFASVIAQVLQDRGFRIQGGTIARHRRGACSCGFAG